MALRAKLVKNAKQAGRNLAGSHPAGRFVLRMNRGSAALMAGPGTTVCIEGFPRSANTFAYEAFRRSNPSAKIAHHLHLPSQVLSAAAHAIPCAVLVRRPLDALSSMLIVDTNLSPTIALRSYVNFYRRCWLVRDAVVTCVFDEVVADPGIVAERLNDRFGTTFNRPDPPSSEERAELLGAIESSHRHRRLDDRLVPVPTEDKDRRKEAVKATLLSHRLMPEADRLFEAWSTLAGSPHVEI